MFYFISALDSKAPKAEDIEEEDDDVPGMNHQTFESQILNYSRSQKPISHISLLFSQ